MPQECISDRVLHTDVGLSTLSLVIGQEPPLASVAAITAPLLTVISTAHSYSKQVFQKGFKIKKYFKMRRVFHFLFLEFKIIFSTFICT